MDLKNSFQRILKSMDYLILVKIVFIFVQEWKIREI